VTSRMRGMPLNCQGDQKKYAIKCPTEGCQKTFSPPHCVSPALIPQFSGAIITAATEYRNPSLYIPTYSSSEGLQSPHWPPTPSTYLHPLYSQHVSASIFQTYKSGVDRFRYKRAPERRGLCQQPGSPNTPEGKQAQQSSVSFACSNSNSCSSS